MKTIDFDVETKIKTNVKQLVKLSHEAFEAVAQKVNVKDEEGKNVLLNLLSYYQSVMLSYLCINAENNKLIEALYEGSIYFVIKDKHPIVDNTFGGKWGEKTKLTDIKSNTLSVGDVVNCTDTETDKQYKGIVLKTPIMSAIPDDYFILLEDNRVIISVNFDGWVVELAEKEYYDDFIKLTNNKLIEAKEYEIEK